MTTHALPSFTLRNPGPARPDDALVTGVPLRPGLVTDPSVLALQDLPSSCMATAHWTDGSVKWLLVTVPHIALAAGERRRVTLTRGTPAPADIMLRHAEDGLRVETSALRFTLATAGALVPSIEVCAGDAWVTRATELDLCTGIERDGVVSWFLASAAPRSIEIECHEAHRAVLCIRGTHQAADGATFAPYTLRLEVLARRAELRLTHSIIFDGDPERDFLRASEVTLTARIGTGTAYAFGADAGGEERFTRQYTPWHADFHHAELYQDSVSHWRLRRWVDRDRRAVFGAEGLRADGWMELSGDGGRVAAAVREAWQQSPKALALDAETGALTISLYPRHAERLDLRRYSDRIYPMAYEVPCTWKEETLPVDPTRGAHGIRKTHDLLLLFDHANPALAAHAFQHPLRLGWTPAYLAKTGALLPATTRLDRKRLRQVNGWIDFLADAMPRQGGTGYLDYFDLPMGYHESAGRFTHDYGGHGYLNNEALLGLGLWLAAFYTGRDDAFALARAMVRHHGDIDSYHLGCWAGYGSRHHVDHWGDACKEPRISQPIDKRYLLYLWGDRSPLDLLRVMLAMWDRLPVSALPVSAHVPALVSTLLTATETGVADETAWLLRLADALAASVNAGGGITALLEIDPAGRDARPLPASGPLSLMMFSCFGGVQNFAELAERYDHAPLRDALVRLARAQLRPLSERILSDGEGAMFDSLNTVRLLDLFAYAYQLTGDPIFPAHVHTHTQTIRVTVADRPATRYGASAGTRRALIEHPWPEEDDTYRAAALRYRPVPHVATAHLFEIAVYLHKLPGLG